MLLPALNTAREKARSIKCTSNLHNAYTMARLYMDDNNDFWPNQKGTGSANSVNAWPWQLKLGGYIQSDIATAGELAEAGLPAYRCPSVKHTKMMLFQTYASACKPKGDSSLGFNLHQGSLQCTKVTKIHIAPSNRMFMIEAFSPKLDANGIANAFFFTGDDSGHIVTIHKGRFNLITQAGNAVSITPKEVDQYYTPWYEENNPAGDHLTQIEKKYYEPGSTTEISL
jgi:hypothetical protein